MERGYRNGLETEPSKRPCYSNKSFCKLRNGPIQFIMPQYLILAALQGDIWILDARQPSYARKWGLIDLLNNSEEELGNKNKSDALIMSIALLETRWQLTSIM